MKTNIRKTLALGIALAAGIVRADRIVVTQDRESALYAAGEEARFSVSVVDDAVARRVGGVEKAQDFFLYYRIPGRQHCHCAPYPHGFVGEPKNLREKIVAWVEKGERPEAIVVPFVDEPDTTLPLRPYPAPNRK